MASKEGRGSGLQVIYSEQLPEKQKYKKIQWMQQISNTLQNVYFIASKLTELNIKTLNIKIKQILKSYTQNSQKRETISDIFWNNF